MFGQPRTDLRHSQMVGLLRELAQKPFNALDPLFAAEAAAIISETGQGHLLLEEDGMEVLWSETFASDSNPVGKMVRRRTSTGS